MAKNKTAMTGIVSGVGSVVVGMFGAQFFGAASPFIVAFGVVALIGGLVANFMD